MSPRNRLGKPGAPKLGQGSGSLIFWAIFLPIITLTLASIDQGNLTIGDYRTLNQ